jgi:hypothetical protein
MQESEQKVITLSGVDESALEELINFAYCGQVRPTPRTGSLRRTTCAPTARFCSIMTVYSCLWLTPLGWAVTGHPDGGHGDRPAGGGQPPADASGASRRGNHVMLVNLL